jgi:hypothetical protein
MGFENRVLRKIFGYKRAERTGSWRKWQNEKLHDFTLLIYIYMIKARRMKCKMNWGRREL